MSKFLSKDGAEIIRYIVKFFGRSTIYMAVCFGILTGSSALIAGPLGVFLGASICIGLLVATLFHLYERG